MLFRSKRRTNCFRLYSRKSKMKGICLSCIQNYGLRRFLTSASKDVECAECGAENVGQAVSSRDGQRCLRSATSLGRPAAPLLAHPVPPQNKVTLFFQLGLDGSAQPIKVFGASEMFMGGFGCRQSEQPLFRVVALQAGRSVGGDKFLHGPLLSITRREEMLRKPAWVQKRRVGSQMPLVIPLRSRRCAIQ